ncbi:MAG TPA: pseudouridine synthase [Candidatus Eisenbacteria bacterium]|nr:pseudouridine synthase [Candidatus Eisenbacteria bacterium]
MKQDASTIRLDKFLSNAGIISRRGVKHFLKENEVTVDGKRFTESGTRVEATSEVLINGKKVSKPGFVYFLLNKPIGIISSTNDEFARDTVVSLVDTNERIYPVGRLDKETHGLVLLTNDGELTHKLIHPKYHVPKVYRLLINGKPTQHQLEQFRMGVFLRDGITLPAEVTVVKTVLPGGSRDSNQIQTILEVTLHEGRNRQIRRMCEEVGLELVDLERTAFGPLRLGELERGEYRALSKKEIQSLKDAVIKP